MRSVLILGHSGFIGRHVMRSVGSHLPTARVVGCDRDEIDLTDSEQVETLAERFDPQVTVVMCSGVKRQLGDTHDTFLQNVEMVANVCRLLEQRPVHRFIYLSSAAVYGEETTNTEISESTPVHPTSKYGIAKFASELLLRSAVATHGRTALLIVRPPLTYGPGDLGLYGPSGFAQSALREGKIELWGDGQELREFLFVEDLAELVAQLVCHDYDGILNAVCGRSYSFRQLADVVSRRVPGISVESKPRTKQTADHAFRGELVRRLLPDFAFTSLDDGVERTIAAAAFVEASG